MSKQKFNMKGETYLLEFITEYWMAAAFAGVAVAFEMIYKQQAAIRKGMRSLLRAELISAHNRCKDRGYIPIYELENTEEMYKQYQALGGNGAVTKLIEDLRDMPTGIDISPT